MLTFHSQNTFIRLVKPASSRCVTLAELDSILLMKWLSLLQMPLLVVIWTIVTFCLDVSQASISTSCRVTISLSDQQLFSRTSNFLMLLVWWTRNIFHLRSNTDNNANNSLGGRCWHKFLVMTCHGHQVLIYQKYESIEFHWVSWQYL